MHESKAESNFKGRRLAWIKRPLSQPLITDYRCRQTPQMDNIIFTLIFSNLQKKQNFKVKLSSHNTFTLLLIVSAA